MAATADVRTFGAKGDGVTDDYRAFESAISSIAMGAVIIPAGTYVLKSPLLIRKSVVLRGEGAGKTNLIFDLGGSTKSAISVLGNQTGSWVNLAGGYTKGSTSLVFNPNDALSLKPGSFALIRQANDPAIMYTDPEWKQDWAEYAVGEVVKIVSQSGNTINIEEPLRMYYTSSLNPQMVAISAVQYAGIEKLHVKRLDKGDAHMIEFEKTAYSFVREVESEFAYRSHIQVGKSYAVEIRDNYIHHAHDYGGGGHGYGVELIGQTTNSLVENNIFIQLRHSMMVHVGATGNVFGYNYSREPVSEKTPLPDISIHGHYPNFNLFEGNIVQELVIADYWGPAGPGNVYFRNRVESKNIFVRDHSSQQIVAGNEIVKGKITVDSTATNNLIHGNLVNGKVSWDPTIGERILPFSYYQGSRPKFYGSMRWPSVGADIPGGTNPALERYKTGSYIP